MVMMVYMNCYNVICHCVACSELSEGPGEAISIQFSGEWGVESG